jgi:GH25 family lysozyme M1 (1,4-beta-N-acetylmuramidase)
VLFSTIAATEVAMRRSWAVVAVVVLAGCGGSNEVDSQAGASDVRGADGPTLQGIDISHYQGGIDWGAVHRSGRAFAIAQIGDGFYRDPTFRGNWDAIKANGMVRGAYQFYRAADDPAGQADIVVAAVGRLGDGDLPVTLDIEGESMQGEPASVIVDRVRTWMDVVERGTGKKPIIYTGYYSWNDSVGSRAFGDHPLWIASYTNAPGIPMGWNRWTFWQYTSSGRVPGIGTNVDLDVFNGSQQDLDKLAGGGSPTPVPHETAPARDVAVRGDGSGYALDGWGGIHPFGGAPAVAGAPSWPDWDIARRIALRPDGVSGYVLDGWGGLHPFGGAPAASGGPYWKGWDIARAVALRGDGKSGYVLDGWGGIHPFGGAPEVDGGPYWQGWDIARDLVLRDDGTSGYVLDGWGGIHPFGGAPEVDGGAYWQGWDIARRLALGFDGQSGYLLDGWGGLHPFGGAPDTEGAAYWQGKDVARGVALKRDGSGGVTLHIDGGVHGFALKAHGRRLALNGGDGFALDGTGALSAIGSPGASDGAPNWGGWDIARGVQLRADGGGYVLDGWGGIHPFGGAPAVGGGA